MSADLFDRADHESRSPLPAPDSPLDEEADEPTAEEIAQQIVDLESQQRLWLKAILPLLQLRSADADPSDRVQFAFDQMTVAACERAARILRGDLQPDEG
ncbi:MAG TPA: hypothetical protein VKA15_19575 [Isosphaeraceae bacterium]|nr:hypothetical protein [Isosphaeraceae bacterium]